VCNGEERRATDHTAVLDPDRRRDTRLPSGLISREDALRLAYYEGPLAPLGGPFASLRLGDEITFYEVSFDGKIYRGLARPSPKRNGQFGRDSQFELARSCAPGLKSDGWLLPPPTMVPNTPRALLAEMQVILQVDAAEIVTRAYSILNYRRHQGGQYPDTMEPPGYRFDRIFLMSVHEDCAVKCLYETPRGVSPEKWTYFLRELDRPSERDLLVRYLASGMAERDFGRDGAAAMRSAVILRRGPLAACDPLPFGNFVDAFKIVYEGRIERTVGGSRR
jgi:hypothetical protein